MMLVNILKRKDASSVIVAIVLGTVTWQTLQSITSDLAATLSGVKGQEGFFGGAYAPPGAGWEQLYLYPIVWMAVQIIALEILAWLVVGVNMAIKTPAKKKR